MFYLALILATLLAPPAQPPMVVSFADPKWVEIWSELPCEPVDNCGVLQPPTRQGPRVWVLGVVSLANGGNTGPDRPGGIVTIRFPGCGRSVVKLLSASGDLMVYDLGMPSDLDGSGTVDSGDFFAVINGVFSGEPFDYNDDGLTNSDDLFDFLRCFLNP